MQPNERDGVVIAPGRQMRLSTGMRHVLRLPADYMTVTFLVESSGDIEHAYPKYELRSTDGAYSKTLSAKDDLVPGDDYLQLAFEKLAPGKRYTLRRLDGPTCSHTVFTAVPYEDVVDQPRAMHETLRAHAYTAFSSIAVEGTALPDWCLDDDEAG
jgi:hypothetical protein